MPGVHVDAQVVRFTYPEISMKFPLKSPMYRFSQGVLFL